MKEKRVNRPAYRSIPANFNAFVTRPWAPKEAMNIKASGTPPVLAKTEAMATKTLRLCCPILTIADARAAPITAETSADANESLIESRKPWA